MLYRRIITTIVAVLALAVPPAAFAMPGTDLAGSDTSSAATAGTDLRSPDARDAAAAAVGSTTQDLRSPDARDAAVSGSLSGTVSAPDTSVNPVPTVFADDGFEWGSAGIGAAAMLAIVLGLAAAVALVVPRRRLRSPIPH